MFASRTRGPGGLALCSLAAILGAALTTGALLAAWQEATVPVPASVGPTLVSAVLETAEWGNTRAFWDSRSKGGGAFSGGSSGTGNAGTSSNTGFASGGLSTSERSNLGAGLGAIGREGAVTSRGSSAVGRSGVYRTVCVRLCDGFYFPIKAATTSATFAEDEDACRSACASPARLFIYPTDTGTPEDMTDTSGRPYSKLPTAFLYRTTYDAACTCRPHAWETAAGDKHKLYAAEASANAIKLPKERKAALSALEPLRKQIAEADRAARKAGEAEGKDILAKLASIERTGIVQRASASAGSAASWSGSRGSSDDSWSSSGDNPYVMMRLGGPRSKAKSSSGSSSRKRPR